MNIRIVGNYIGKILLLECASMTPALLIAIFGGEGAPSIGGFALTMLALLAVGGLLLLPKPRARDIYAREGFVIVALSWIAIAVFGALPFFISRSIPNYLNALFETISGFTTTGATILADVEALSAGMLYWRSFTHWLGGMGVLVFILALAPLSKGNGMALHILRAESPGPNVGKLAPKMQRTARILYLIYFVMTVVEIILLLCGGMPPLDAVTTSFGTAGTGGFAIKNASVAPYSTYCQTVIGIFMLLFGVNFNIYYLALIGDLRSVLKNTELRWYLIIIALSTGAITLNCLSMFNSAGEALHHSFFTVSSIITTTGFATADFNLWPEFSHTLLMLLMVIGACAGSTGGGIKVSRVIILTKSLKNEVKKLLHPRSVTTVKIDGKPLDEATIKHVNVFFVTYAFVIILSVLALSVEGQSFKTNFSAVLACINNIGPGLDAVGPVANYSIFAPFGKVVLMLNMLLGRLELFPMLLLFAPATWRAGR